MPDVSARSHTLPPSPIRKLAGFADKARKQGKFVYGLNIGQPDVHTPQEFWDALDAAPRDNVPYSHSAGLDTLRVAFAQHYCDMGLDVTAEQVMVTTAGSEALQMAMIACLDAGDEVIIPEPMYANYIGFAALTNVKVVPLTTRIEDNFALPSTAEFEAKITPKTRAILICNPSNPTGTVYDEAQLEELRALALAKNLFLIGDEVYRDFNYTGKPIKSLLQLSGMDEHVVVIDSASKKYSLCGSRVGFLISRNSKVMDAALRYGMARLSPPTFEQYGLLGALKAPKSYIEGVRLEYQSRRDTLVNRLRAMPGVVCPDIQGAFYATVRLPVEDADEFCQWILTDFSIDNETVMMAPASGFYSTSGLGRDEVRIAYVLNEAKLHKAMDILEAALVAYPHSTLASAK